MHLDEIIERLEVIVLLYLKDILGVDPLDIKINDKLVHAAKALSADFTLGRSRLAPNYMDGFLPGNAYLAHFFLTNAAKVVFCLNQSIDLFDTSGPFKILDFGCGPGSAALGASEFFADSAPDLRLEINVTDKSRNATDISQKLFEKLERRNHFLTAVTKVEGRFDLIIAANVLNEFGDWDESYNLVRKLISEHLNENGLMIIIDPALRSTTKPLMSLRNRLVAEKCADVLAPCLHNKNCPMLASNERDWCHFYIEWTRPRLIQTMDELVGTDHKHLKMAYFILSHPNKRPAANDELMYLCRTVSSPLKSKGKTELVLCGSNGGLKRIMRQHKNASRDNADFDKVQRGDIISCSSVGKIEKDDSFKVIRCWGQL